MQKMIQITDKQACCGCGACAQVCPRHCISMTPDQEGFLYPAVNRAACVDCGLCEKVCPLGSRQEIQGQVRARAAFCKDDEIRLNSSSGGIFSLLAEEILQKGGVVFGAAFDSQMMVHHVAVESVCDLGQLRGSKYLQSRMGNSYQAAKAYLTAGRKVLFSGTACQIAGLKSYLGRPCENLWTVDVLCHGVPAPALWKKYLDEKSREYAVPVEQVSFRDKSEGWKEYRVTLQLRDGVICSQSVAQNPYMQLFLSNICLRPSCHACPFKGFPRVSDLTLGDCWDVEQYAPEMDDDRGTSVVIASTEKGEALWQKIAGRCVWKEEKLDVLLPPRADSRKPVQPHPHRKKFFAWMAQGKSVDELLRLLYPPLAVRVKNRVKRLLAR